MRRRLKSRLSLRLLLRLWLRGAEGVRRRRCASCPCFLRQRQRGLVSFLQVRVGQVEVALSWRGLGRGRIMARIPTAVWRIQLWRLRRRSVDLRLRRVYGRGRVFVVTARLRAVLSVCRTAGRGAILAEWLADRLTGTNTDAEWYWGTVGQRSDMRCVHAICWSLGSGYLWLRYLRTRYLRATREGP